MKLLPQGIEITEVDFASPNKAFFIQKHLKEGDDKAPDHPEQIIWKAYQGNIGISCKIQCNFSFLLMYFFFLSAVDSSPQSIPTPALNFLTANPTLYPKSMHLITSI